MRSRNISLPVSLNELRMFRDLARAQNLGVAAFIRRSILGDRVDPDGRGQWKAKRAAAREPDPWAEDIVCYVKHYGSITSGKAIQLNGGDPFDADDKLRVVRVLKDLGFTALREERGDRSSWFWYPPDSEVCAALPAAALYEPDPTNELSEIEATILAFCSRFNQVTTSQILADGLGRDRWLKAEEMQITSVLRMAGYRSRRASVNGVRGNWWSKRHPAYRQPLDDE